MISEFAASCGEVAELTALIYWKQTSKDYYLPLLVTVRLDGGDSKQKSFDITYLINRQQSSNHS